MTVYISKTISHNTSVCPKFYELVSKNYMELKTYIRHLFVKTYMYNCLTLSLSFATPSIVYLYVEYHPLIST